MAGDAENKARQAPAAANVTGQVKQLLDRQVGSGADILGHVAGAVERAAQELDRDAPQLAGMVRSAAEQMNGYADGLRDQSLEQLMREASDFTRRQPAVVFGLSALAGFFVLRTLKSTPSSVARRRSSPPTTAAGNVPWRSTGSRMLRCRTRSLTWSVIWPTVPKEMRLARAELSEKIATKLQAGIWMSVPASWR